jgi:hypothetical protein
LQDQVSACFTCLQETDDLNHILMGCVYARQVWHGVFQRLQVQIATPEQDDSTHSWWLATRKRIGTQERRSFDSLVILVCWRVWKQRNARVFLDQRRQFTVPGLVDQITEDWNQVTWALHPNALCTLPYRACAMAADSADGDTSERLEQNDDLIGFLCCGHLFPLG